MKKINMLLITSLIFILFSQFSVAQMLDEYEIDFLVAFNKIVVKQKMIFEENTNGNIIVNMPDDFSGLSVYINEELITPELFENKLNINLKSAKSVKIIFVTREYIEENEFISHIKMPFDAKEVKISLTLPEGIVLEKPLTESGSGSAYPKPTKMETDGQSIILVWRYDNLKREDEKSFFVRYKKKTNIHLYIILILFAVIVAFSIYFLLERQKTRQKSKALKKSREIKTEKKIKEETEKKAKIAKTIGGFEKHLKEDEEQIINILKQREGQCEQGTLRVITGFSKAKLSGLLKELEDRKIIFKEKRGKKNLVFLKEP
ncbi:MAG: hypothetical protein N3D84_00005 [Candidatus Woesearchaeota archaeon]|nr:hypothetical protein [Candidatus Woesearchaeota archaeon]